MLKQNLSPGDIVFAKLKGFPWWPARIEDENTLPPEVQRKKELPHKAHELFVVFFYGSLDYGLFARTKLRPFDPERVKRDFENNKFKTAAHKEAIEQALEPNFLDDYFKELKKVRSSKDKRKKNNNKKSTGVKKNSSPTTTESSLNNNNNKKRKKNRKQLSVSLVEAATKSPIYERSLYHLYYMRISIQHLAFKKIQGEILVSNYSKIDDILKQIEQWPMTLDFLKDSKLYKVLYNITKYEFENDESTYRIKERCYKLLWHWKTTLIDPYLQNKGYEAKTSLLDLPSLDNVYNQ
ncbi:hypothetical protein BJ944DRAFT_163809 [Cunninghamella echinulata]|nr:hypothetical protein BJ944DRAFT_163809 [Cunninghamella echinulata]